MVRGQTALPPPLTPPSTTNATTPPRSALYRRSSWKLSARSFARQLRHFGTAGFSGCPMEIMIYGPTSNAHCNEVFLSGVMEFRARGRRTAGSAAMDAPSNNG
ncbi:hypothetical protein KM043_004532 [Ampulex compressa]|nr:hypothetical protein KM043_004532 [Ampulex compressa]